MAGFSLGILSSYTSSSFTPPTTNLAAHWDASNAGSIISSGGLVSQWSDLSGNNRHLLQATTLNKPVVSGSGLSTEIHFTRFATGGSCSMSASWTQNQPVTVYMVFKNNNWSANDGVWDGIGANSMLLRMRPSSPGLGMYAGSAFLDQSKTSLAYQVVATVYDGTSSFSVNDIGTIVTGSPGTSSPGGFWLGASGSGSLCSDITVREIYYYSANHSTATQTSMMNYLRNRWSVQNTLDPVNKGSNITLSNNNLTAGNTAYSFACVRGLISLAHSTGQYYCEFVSNNIGPSGNQAGVGFGNASAGLNAYLGSDVNGWMYWSQVGAVSNYYNNGSVLTPTPTLVYTYGDVLGMALDLTAGKAWFSVNGVWNNSGNPATGANPSFTFTTGVTYYPMASFFWGNATMNFGATAYTYTPPLGFNNW